MGFKLCVFTFGFSPNRKAMLNYLEKVLPKNIEIFLFVPMQKRELYRPLQRIKIVKTKCNRKNSFLELKKFCKEKNISSIINIGLLPYEAIPMVYASFFTKTKIICYNLGNPFDGIYTGSYFRRLRCFMEYFVSIFVFLFSSKIVFCSKNLTRRAEKYFFMLKNKIAYLPPTISTDFFKPKNKNLLRKKMGFGKNEKIVLFVGRIGYYKGADIILELAKRNPDKKFLLIGEIVEEEFKKVKPPNFLILLNKSPSELIDYYNLADLCLFPSRIEGLPLVPREAMSCGTPVLMSDIPSSLSLKGILRAPLKTDEMHKELNNFFSLSKKYVSSLSFSSRKFIKDFYDDLIWKKEYEKVITT